VTPLSLGFYLYMPLTPNPREENKGFAASLE
jgi:hypothetical protein